MTKRVWLATAALAAAAGGAGLGAPPARADSTVLNVSPGLWEVTVIGERQGEMQIPQDALAKMTPEQRAKVEAMMANMPRTMKHVMRECLTEQQIRDGMRMLDRKEADCQRTIVTQTRTVLEVHEQCAGARPRTVTARFEAPTPGALQGHVVAEMTQGMHTMTMTSNVTGTRLGSDCGDIPPGEVRRE